MTYTLPPHPGQESIVPIDAQVLDEAHWRRLSVGELIRAMDQAYVLMPPAGWRMSCFVAAHGQKVTGITVYRRPASLRAWLSVAWPAFVKIVSRRWGV